VELKLATTLATRHKGLSSNSKLILRQGQVWSQFFMIKTLHRFYWVAITLNLELRRLKTEYRQSTKIEIGLFHKMKQQSGYKKLACFLRTGNKILSNKSLPPFKARFTRGVLLLNLLHLKKSIVTKGHQDWFKLSDLSLSKIMMNRFTWMSILMK